MLERMLLRVHEDVQAEKRLAEGSRRDVDETVRRLRDPDPDRDLILFSAKELREPIVVA
jgi:hypothetical protein